MIKAVVFDMDGVLFDTERICLEAWNEAAILMEEAPGDIEASLKDCIGLNRNDTQLYFQEKYGEDFDYDKFRQLNSKAFGEIIARDGLPVKDGVYEILEYLKKAGTRIALASSSRRVSVLGHLKEAGITDYFEAVVTGDMVEHSKPDPEIYRMACESLGLPPCEVMAVEDSPNGIRSAAAAGMKAVMVPDLVQPDEEISQLLYLKCDSLLGIVDYLKKYKTYVEILDRELIPAMGCTEPIAVAYCAACARELLQKRPEKVRIMASGNIIKNVKSVIVPNTNGQKGLEAAAAVGIIAGDAARQLEVIADVSQEEKEELAGYLKKADIWVEPADNGFVLDITVEVFCQGDSASVRIVNEHTNIVRKERNGEILFNKDPEGCAENDKEEDCPDYGLLNIEDICRFAEKADLDDVRPVLKRQIECNTAISAEGIRGDYGANIGSVLLQAYGDNIHIRAKAVAAAGSDARMNGCELPVVINSGSGNQGMTASLPVIEYAREYGVDDDTLYRALLVSNLSTIHQKSHIGRLSAYCGAVSAGAGAGAGIAWLLGGGYREVAHTIVNALAITSGIVCDGAKPSCAAKIAAAVDAGILGYEMYIHGQQFYGGDGVISKGIENTINNIGRLGKEGMKETDREIIQIMTAGRELQKDDKSGKE